MYPLNSFATILQRSIGVDHSSYQPVPTGDHGLGYTFVVSVNTTALQSYHHHDPHLLGGRVGIWRDHVTCLRRHSWGERGKLVSTPGRTNSKTHAFYFVERFKMFIL